MSYARVMEKFARIERESIWTDFSFSLGWFEKDSLDYIFIRHRAWKTHTHKNREIPIPSPAITLSS